MSRLSFAFSTPTLLLGLPRIALAGWLSFQHWRRNGARRSLLGLEGFRWVLVLLIFLTLGRPEWIQSIPPHTQPEVVILFDASRSMTTRDVVIDETIVRGRDEWLQQQREAEFWKLLAEKFKVVVTDFSAPPGQEPANDAVETAATTIEEGTDINAALEHALSAHRNLRAVVLLSDGDWNLGKSPVAAATKLRMENIPVFAVAVGSEKHLPDIEVKRVSAPAYGLIGEQVFIPFTIQSHLPRDVRTTLSLASGGAVEASKEVVLPAMSQLQDALFWMPQREGKYALTLRVPVERDEMRGDNNEQTFPIAIRQEKLKVLVVDSLPRWEYRFLHNALSRDPGVDVHCVLFHPGMKSGGGRDYLPSFPNTKEALSPYDVVFLGDVGIGSNELTLQDAELLEGLVEQQGSGLVFIPGARGRQLTFQDTPLADLLPVSLDPDKPQGLRSPTPSQLVLTRSGRGHLLTMLASSENQNYRLWQNLPGFYWHVAVNKSRPGSEVLAVHDTYRNQWGKIPLLVTRPAGNGKTLFLGIDSVWRWRSGVEDTYHYRFWGQVVRWMSYQRHLAHDQGFRLLVSPEAPRKDEMVTLSATVFARAGLPLNDGHVTADIASPGGLTERLILNPVKGGWGVYQGEFTPSQRGQYKITLRCKETAREMETELLVQGVQREEVGRPAQAEVLREIASITHGQFGNTGDLQDFVQKISSLPEQPPVERRVKIWCHPLWGALLITMLAIYWIGRKFAGLV